MNKTSGLEAHFEIFYSTLSVEIIGYNSAIGINNSFIIYFSYCAPENLRTRIRQKKDSQNPNGAYMCVFEVQAPFKSLSLGAQEACQCPG